MSPDQLMEGLSKCCGSVILVDKKNYDTLKEICRECNLEVYVWEVVNIISIHSDKKDADLLVSPEVLNMHKSQLVDPDWNDIKNLIHFHSFSVTFL